MISSSLNYAENERTASFELTQQRSSINLIDFHSHSAVRQPALEFQLDSVTRRATQCKLRIINSVDRHVGKFQLIQQVKSSCLRDRKRVRRVVSGEKWREISFVVFYGYSLGFINSLCAQSTIPLQLIFSTLLCVYMCELKLNSQVERDVKTMILYRVTFYPFCTECGKYKLKLSRVVWLYVCIC